MTNYVYPTDVMDIPLEVVIGQAIDEHIMDTMDADDNYETTVGIITQEVRVAEKLTSAGFTLHRASHNLWYVLLNGTVSLSDLLTTVGGAVSARYSTVYNAITLVHDEFPD